MRIAIVDDIASERETLKGRVTAQAARLSLDASVSCYASGTDLLACAGKEHFDLVFLDIDVVHLLVEFFYFSLRLARAPV